MSHALRKITANASKCHCTVLFLNQLRFKVGLLASTRTCSGTFIARQMCLHCLLANEGSGHHAP